jgi:hypothetical protein
VSEEAREAVLVVIQNMGFKEQLASGGGGSGTKPTGSMRPELAIVQDAGTRALPSSVIALPCWLCRWR